MKEEVIPEVETGDEVTVTLQGRVSDVYKDQKFMRFTLCDEAGQWMTLWMRHPLIKAIQVEAPSLEVGTGAVYNPHHLCHVPHGTVVLGVNDDTVYVFDSYSRGWYAPGIRAGFEQLPTQGYEVFKLGRRERTPGK